MRLIRTGQTHAFRELMQRHLRGAMAVAQEFARDRDEAEDLVQEAFCRALQKLDGFDASRPFRPWFYTIVRNVGRNETRRPVRNRTSALLDDQMASDQLGDPVVDDQLRSTVEKELAAMSTLQAQCFRLCAIEGFSAQEVGDMLGIVPATVRTHVHRARLRLRDVLTALGYQEME